MALVAPGQRSVSQILTAGRASSIQQLCLCQGRRLMEELDQRQCSTWSVTLINLGQVMPSTSQYTPGQHSLIFCNSKVPSQGDFLHWCTRSPGGARWELFFVSPCLPGVYPIILSALLSGDCRPCWRSCRMSKPTVPRVRVSHQDLGFWYIVIRDAHHFASVMTSVKPNLNWAYWALMHRSHSVTVSTTASNRDGCSLSTKFRARATFS